MTVLLTENLPLLADASNGIKKLRELILGLAVRGKLVPQDASEEPASELLKRITEEKARLGNLKKQKPLTHIDGDEAPFDLPKSWQWARLGDLSELITSGSRDWAQHYSDDGAIFVRMGNLSRRSYALRLGSIQRVSPPKNGEGSRTKLEPGDLLLSITGEVGLLGLIPEKFGEAYINQHVCLIRFVSSIRGRFLPEALRSPLAYEQYEAPQRGIKNSFRLRDVSQTLVPLPPLAEQHRIVTKIDELMALCDRMEAQQADSENAHTQLVQVLLDSLTQTSDAAGFAASWQRLTGHFHTLFTTESSIDALKQTLLQLAVMGKLVPQDSNDEPASELLKRMADGKAELVKSGQIKAPKPLPEVKQEEIPYGLPKTWMWVRLGDISEFANGDRGKNYPNRSEYVSEGLPWINTGHIEPDGSLGQNGMHYITREKFNSLNGGKIRLGDLVYCLRGATFGKTAIVDPYSEGAIASSLMIIRPFAPCSNRYMYRYLTSQAGKDQIFRFDNGSAQPNLSANNVRLYVYPLPPLAEQHRIVAKVDQLMDFCHQLKTRLSQARQLNEQLASTLVERALVEGRQQPSVATDRKVARTLLAAEITHQLHSQRTFGQRKLQKVIYLAEHTARLAAIQGNYLRDAAGPHDRQLMSKVEGEMQDHQWYERIERETVGHAYHPLPQAGQHRQAYSSTWSAAERATIEQVIELMRDWDTDRCEMTVTLYAAWNDFILEGRPVSDEAIVDEVMHRWNDTKLRFDKPEWLAVLAEMKKHKILMPTGFGKRTTGGMLSLPGFE